MEVAVNDLNKRLVNVNMTADHKTLLLKATDVVGPDIDHLKFKITDVHLRIDRTARTRLFLGTQCLFDRSGTNAHEHHVESVDMENKGDLYIQAENGAILDGQIHYMFV